MALAHTVSRNKDSRPAYTAPTCFERAGTDGRVGELLHRARAEGAGVR